MKLSLISLVCVAALTGCAGNQGLEAKVADMQQRAHSQDEQIAALKKDLAVKEEAGKSALGSAWDWTVTHTTEAWNSDTSQEARLRFRKCWNDLAESKK